MQQPRFISNIAGLFAITVLASFMSACFEDPLPFPLPDGIILKVGSGVGGHVAVSNFSQDLYQCSEYAFKSHCYRYSDSKSDTVTLSATPDSGYQFDGWSGACAGLTDCTLSMHKTQRVTAIFSSADYDFSPLLPMISTYLQDYPNYKGAAVAVVHRDKGVVYEAAIGNQNLDTIALVASASKVPVAGILMSLIDDGLIERDKPIEHYIFDWRPVYSGMTIEHTLSNTSGLPGLLTHPDASGLYNLHICSFSPFSKLQSCARHLFQIDWGNDYVAPGTVFNYGGGQWQIAGAVAEKVTGKSWSSVVQDKLVKPCGLNVMKFGLNLTEQWNGHPDTLIETKNPYIEAGAIGNIHDFGKIMLMHLNDGQCDGQQVMSAASVAEMRVDRGTPAGKDPLKRLTDNGQWSFPSGYGMGWWIKLPETAEPPSVFYDAGSYGSLVLMNTKLGYGIYVQMEDYTFPPDGPKLETAIEDFLLRVLPLMDGIFAP
ncbi:MAG: beta-lactamase family protein [Pseudomonadales bacterium]|nr:beta-lactamase family protein [Pseudomonadales bacterium]